VEAACIFFMTLINSILVCHRKENLRLKVLIVSDSKIHVTLRCVRRVVSASCISFGVQISPCKIFLGLLIPEDKDSVFFKMSANAHMTWCHVLGRHESSFNCF
jgi:hypothetical protein